MTFGTRLKNLINEKSITQKQLANDLNIALSTLNGYLQDYREPDFATLIILANYFSVSTDYLLGHSEYTITTKGKLNLNSGETEIIRLYRLLNSEYQNLLIEQAKLYFRISEENKKLLNTTSKTGTNK